VPLARWALNGSLTMLPKVPLSPTITIIVLFAAGV
jgi:hypothetical protein